jgi:hypothetical protein
MKKRTNKALQKAKAKYCQESSSEETENIITTTTRKQHSTARVRHSNSQTSSDFKP